MERVIKFRAWHLESKEMLFGNLREIGQWLEEKQPIVIMQFTGLLKGKQGKHEIFEGNIYKWGWSVERIGVVKFNTAYAGWVLEYKVGTGTMSRSLTPEFIEEMEYVGNVHEHPHLIK